MGVGTAHERARALTQAYMHIRTFMNVWRAMQRLKPSKEGMNTLQGLYANPWPPWTLGHLRHRPMH